MLIAASIGGLSLVITAFIGIFVTTWIIGKNCSNEFRSRFYDQFAEVDHMEDADTIKLKRDSAGKHHYIPLSWVTSVEGGKVKIDRLGGQAMQEWSETRLYEIA